MARCLLDKAKSDLENYAILHFKALKRNLQQQQEFTHKSIKTARIFSPPPPPPPSPARVKCTSKEALGNASSSYNPCSWKTENDKILISFFSN